MWQPTHSNSLLEDLMTYSSNGSHPEFVSLLQGLHVLLGIDLSGPDGLALPLLFWVFLKERRSSCSNELII
jgi:hypothetical protein